MGALLRQVRSGLFAILLAVIPAVVSAAPYAAYVMDARTGETLYSQNADTRLYPASLTKMMTLYLTFAAIERGQISLDSVVTVTAHAASQPPSRLGLRAGQKIQLRYLIRAAAVKSANDAAAAIGDYIGGNESGFAARMNRMAGALGMRNTHFVNANGLTRQGHVSSAHDMAILGRHLLYDFPQYYSLFSRRSVDAGLATVYSTNRKFLNAYDGADGIKTGYTVASGFNLVASAKRGDKRVIGAIFGGTSTAQRNSQMAKLLDIGFSRAPSRVTPKPPGAPALIDRNTVIAGAPAQGAAQANVRVAAAEVAPDTSQRPMRRPEDSDTNTVAVANTNAAPIPVPQAAPRDIRLVQTRPAPAPSTVRTGTAQPSSSTALRTAAAQSLAVPPSPPATRPVFVQNAQPQPESVTLASAGSEPAAAAGPVFIQSAQPQPETIAMTKNPNETVLLAAMTPPAPARQRTREVVSRAGGDQNWGVSIGNFNSKYAAERALLTTALTETDTLSDALRKVATRKTGFEAVFVGMNESDAQLACARLEARSHKCSVIGPS